jgi:hypothetical protein
MGVVEVVEVSAGSLTAHPTSKVKMGVAEVVAEVEEGVADSRESNLDHVLKIITSFQ